MALTESLRLGGYDLEFACLRRWGPFVDELGARGIPLTEYQVPSFRSMRGLMQQARFARHVAQKRIQIVHSYNFYGNVFAVPPARAAGTPVVIASIRDCGPYLTPLQRRVQRYACRLADCVLVNAEAVKDWLVADGYEPSRIVVIRNGIDLRPFQRPDDPEWLHRELGLDLFEVVLAQGQLGMIQSLILGPNTNHRKVCAYFDADGAPLACISMREIRQYPIDFGVGTMMESVDDPEVAELGLRFFRAMNWRGPGSVEFKRDDRDGSWKLIELNPRLWQQHGLASASGVDFPLIQYRDLTGQPAAPQQYQLNIWWIDEFRDPRSAWQHFRRGNLTFRQWVHSLARVRECALFARDDPNPFAASLTGLAAGVRRWAWHRLEESLASIRAACKIGKQEHPESRLTEGLHSRARAFASPAAPDERQVPELVEARIGRSGVV